MKQLNRQLKRETKAAQRNYEEIANFWTVKLLVKQKPKSSAKQKGKNLRLWSNSRPPSISKFAWVAG